MDDKPISNSTGWQPIETAPINESVLIWLPRWEHYGPGIYRAIQVDMGTGRRWHTTAWACGRDLDPGEWPRLWRPLPEQPTDLYDVVAINIKTGARRPLATDKTERDAEAIIKMAVMRWGVEEEFYMAIPVGERKPDLADVTRKLVESERAGR